MQLLSLRSECFRLECVQDDFRCFVYWNSNEFWCDSRCDDRCDRLNFRSCDDFCRDRRRFERIFIWNQSVNFEFAFRVHWSSCFIIFQNLFHIHKIFVIHSTLIDSTIDLCAISAFCWYESHITRSFICHAMLARLLDYLTLISNLFRDDSMSDSFDQLDAFDDVWIWVWICVWIWIWIRVVIRFLLLSWRLAWIDHFRSWFWTRLHIMFARWSLFESLLARRQYSYVQ